VADPAFPREDMLYATLLLNASAGDVIQKSLPQGELAFSGVRAAV
jgi:hypothetical protein